MAMTVDIDEIKKTKLVTLDHVRERLSATEPLHEAYISNASKVKFKVGEGWAVGLDKADPDTVVNAYVSVDGHEYPLTKSTLEAAGSAFGLTSAYAKRLPVKLLVEQLDYWYSAGMGDKEFKLLAIGDDKIGSGLTKPQTTTFSNLRLLDEVEEVIAGRYTDDDIYVDYKWNHNLNKTDLRLILPGYTRVIQDTSTANDTWSAGIHLSNSLTGKKGTAIEAYLFRWWCTNGATTTNAEVGRWSRRASEGQDELSVYDWARESVDAVLGGMEKEFEKVQHLARTPLGTNTPDVLREIFSRYGVPLAQQQGIIDSLLAQGSLTMYAVMQAITQQANNFDVSPERQDKLMRIGGFLTNDQFDTRIAQAWNEGHSSPEDASNPYMIGQ